MDLSTLAGLLASLLLPVGAIAWFVSHFLDNTPFWADLKPEVKSVIILIASLVVGGVAYAVLHTVPGTVLDQLQPLYAVVYSIVVAWLAMQVQHQVFVRGQVRMAKIKAQKHQFEYEIKHTVRGIAG